MLYEARAGLQQLYENGEVTEFVRSVTSKYNKEKDSMTAMMHYRMASYAKHVPSMLTEAVLWEQRDPKAYSYASPFKDVMKASELFHGAIGGGSFAACVSMYAKVREVESRFANCELCDIWPSFNPHRYLKCALKNAESWDAVDPCYPRTSGVEHELVHVDSIVARTHLLCDYREVKEALDEILKTMNPVTVVERRYWKELETLFKIVTRTIRETPIRERRTAKLKSAKRRERRRRARFRKKESIENECVGEEEHDPLLNAMLEDIDLIDPLTGEFYSYSSDSE